MLDPQKVEAGGLERCGGGGSNQGRICDAPVMLCGR